MSSGSNLSDALSHGRIVGPSNFRDAKFPWLALALVHADKRKGSFRHKSIPPSGTRKQPGEFSHGGAFDIGDGAHDLTT